MRPVIRYGLPLCLAVVLAACSHQPKKPYGTPFPINSGIQTIQDTHHVPQEKTK